MADRRRRLSPQFRAGLARAALLVVPVAFLAVFFAWPVVAIVDRGLRPDGAWDLAALGEVVTDRRLRGVAWFTLWQAAASTLLTLVLALPAAWCFARLRFPGKRVLWALLVVPFVLPTVVVASAFIGLVGPGGATGVDLTGTVWLILAAHAFFNYAVVVRTVGGLWAHLDPAAEEAARVLGASRWGAFRHVTWPALRPAVLAATSIVFLFTFTSFGVVLLLGGRGHRTLEVEIYTQTARLLALDTAAALALVQLVGVVAVLAVYSRVQQRAALAQRLRPAEETAQRPATRGEWAMLVGSGLVAAVLLAAPLVALVTRSFATPDGWGLAAWRALGESRRGSVLFVSPLEAVGNSLRFAALATVIALVVGGLASVAVAAGTRPRAGGDPAAPRVGGVFRWVDTMLMIPLGTSAVTVGFGFLIALDEPPFDWRDAWWLVPVAQAVVAVPFVVRTLVPTLRSIDPALREAASVLGASPLRVWRAVDLPVLARAVAVAAGFAFAVSLGEFGATVFLVRADAPTLPVAVYRFLGQPGPLNQGQAMAMATLLMAVTAAVMVAIDRVRSAAAGRF